MWSESEVRFSVYGSDLLPSAKCVGKEKEREKRERDTQKHLESFFSRT